MTKTFIAATLLSLGLGLGAAQAAEEYQTGVAAGMVSGPAVVAASPILESNAAQAGVQAANSLPPGFAAGTSVGTVQYGTVLNR